MQIPFFKAIEQSRKVLLAGCGGGFDVVSGLPLLMWLKNSGFEVVLGNLSFSRLEIGCRMRVGPAGWLVDEACDYMDYFPERHLVDWLAGRGFPARVIGFEKTGVRQLRASYEAALRLFDIDTVILVDGGTDSLLRGDEALLATIEEDAASIVAVNQLEGPSKFLICLGFGIDHHHGVCHYSFLENTADLIKDGGFLGCISVQKTTPEGDALLDAVAFLNERQPGSRSIVANSIAASMRGEFGNHHDTDRTAGSNLFINALMTLYWSYSLPAVAAKIGFYQDIAETTTFRAIENAVRSYHDRIVRRDWTNMPL